MRLRGLTRKVVWGAVVGVLAGLAAVTFTVVLETVNHLLFERLAGLEVLRPAGEAHLWDGGPPVPFRPLIAFLLPAIGGLLCGIIVHRYAPEAGGVGTDALIRSFHRDRGQMKPRIPAVKGLATIFTLGFGGVSGREGPIAQIGGGIGAWISNRLGLDDRDRRILLLAGAAGGLAAIFRAPLGAAITAIEIPYHEDLETDALVPCVVSSVAGYTVFTEIFGEAPIFDIPAGLGFHRPVELLFYLVLGWLCVPTGSLTVWFFDFVSRAFQKLRAVMPRWAIPAIGGLLVGVVGLCVDGAYGSGWGELQLALAGKLALGTMIGLGLAKLIAMSFTLGSGGSGGVFGPVLFGGAMLGGSFGLISQELFPAIAPDPRAMVLVGMCAMFAGVGKAPLGALLMTAEISRGYGLLAPLMLVSVIAVLFSKSGSIFRQQRHNKFDSPAHRGDLNEAVLRRLLVLDAIESPSTAFTIPERMSTVDARERFLDAGYTWMPVVDVEGHLHGGISLADIREVPHEQEAMGLLLAADLAHPCTAVDASMSLADALPLVLRSKDGGTAVTSGGDRRVIGVLRHEDLLLAYHRAISEDEPDDD